MPATRGCFDTLRMRIRFTVLLFPFPDCANWQSENETTAHTVSRPKLKAWEQNDQYCISYNIQNFKLPTSMYQEAQLERICVLTTLVLFS